MRLLITGILLFVIYTTFAQCERMIVEVDKFDGRKTIRSPYLHAVSFIKDIDKDDTLYLINIEVLAYSASSLGGADVLFNNGMVWRTDDDADVRVNANGRGFYHSVMSYINENDLEIFKKHLITDIRVGVVEGPIKPKNALNYQRWAGCITSLK